MKIEVLFFGITSDLVGTNSVKLELSKVKNVKELKVFLQTKFPKLKELNSYAIAVNENYALEETVVKENDIVAVIPPVSGG